MEQPIEKKIWQERVTNLLRRRKAGKSDNIYTPPAVFDSESHFKKCRLGISVLEVGVGTGDYRVKKYCPGAYIPIDAYPVHSGIIQAQIETYKPKTTFETIVAFAVLDCVHDLRAAISNMKRLCDRNIILLTGLNIPIDEFHTYELTDDKITNLMWPEFKQTYKEELFPNVFLIEYSR